MEKRIDNSIYNDVVYIPDTSNYRTVKLTLDGACVTTNGQCKLYGEQPIAIAVERGGGYAWVGSLRNRIFQF